MYSMTVTMSNENWEFVLDCVGDRLENLGELEWYGEDFSEDIRHAESIINAIEGKMKSACS